MELVKSYPKKTVNFVEDDDEIKPVVADGKY